MVKKENKSIILYFKESYIIDSLINRLLSKNLSVLPINTLNPKHLQNADLIILDEKKEKISSSLSKLKLYKFNGQIIAIFNDNASINYNRAYLKKLQKFMVKPIRISELCEIVLYVINNFAMINDQMFLDSFVKFEEFNNKKTNITKLTEKETALAKRLLKDEGQIVSRTKLLSDVWGYNHLVSTKTLDTHIHRLRSKLARIPNSPRLYTVPGGYKLKLSVNK